MQTSLSLCVSVALCFLSLVRQCCAAAAMADPRAMIGPSILHSDSEDEDIIISSGHTWGSGSGGLSFEGYEDDEDEIPSTKATLLKLVTPDSTRMTCIVCSTVGDPSCRDPYVRNISHVQPCLTSVGGCLKVVTPIGDTYRNCLYGIFATAEKTTGCRVVKEDVHVGHKFVNATICICRTNECNGLFAVTPVPTADASEMISEPTTNLVAIHRRISFGKTPSPTAHPVVPMQAATTTEIVTATTGLPEITPDVTPEPKSSVSALKYSFIFIVAVIGFFFSILPITGRC